MSGRKTRERRRSVERAQRPLGGAIGHPAAGKGDVAAVIGLHAEEFHHLAVTGAVIDGELAGIVYVQAEYPLMAQVWRYLSILGAVLLGSLLIAMLMSSWLQSAIIKPVLALTEAVDQVLMRALSRQPHERFGSMEEFARALAAGSPTAITPVGLPRVSPAVPAPRSRRARWILVA